VFLDASLSTATSSDLWASTGMKLFADGIEMLCSPRATLYQCVGLPIAGAAVSQSAGCGSRCQ
jgi:hypothetical protein